MRQPSKPFTVRCNISLYTLYLRCEPKYVAWGIQPAWVTGGSWYGSLENLKFLRHEEVGFLFGVASNRKLSVGRGKTLAVKEIAIPGDGPMVYLRAFSWVRLFCQPFKNEPRYYILYKTDLAAPKQLTHADFKAIHDDHWKIECFHCIINQVCDIERFYVRDEQAIRNHFFCALRAFFTLQTMCIQGLLNNCCEISRQLFVPVIRQFILENMNDPMFA